MRFVLLIVAVLFCLPQLALAEPSVANLEKLRFRKLLALNQPEQIWAPISRTTGVATAYFKANRKHFRSLAAFEAAQKLNGKGEKTKTGHKPWFGMISANFGRYPPGTYLRITDPKTGLTFVSRVDDTGAAMKRNSKHVDVFLGEDKDGCMLWGKRMVRIETVKLDLSKMLRRRMLGETSV